MVSGHSASRFLAGALAFALLLLPGCRLVPARRAMTEEARAHLHSPRTVVHLPQPPIGVSILGCSRTNPAGPDNLLADAVREGVAQRCEEARLKSALATVGPVRDALAGYDPGAALSADLSRELASLPWFGANQVEVHLGAEGPTAEEIVSRGVQARHPTPVLLIQVDYRLGPTLETLVITAEVSLYAGEMKTRERSNGSKTQDPVIAYHNVLATSAHLGDARQVLDAGFSDLARMMAFDLGGGGESASEENRAQKALVDVPAFPDAWGRVIYPSDPKIAGYIVRESAGYSWVRLPTGELVSSGAPDHLYSTDARFPGASSPPWARASASVSVARQDPGR